MKSIRGSIAILFLGAGCGLCSEPGFCAEALVYSCEQVDPVPFPYQVAVVRQSIWNSGEESTQVLYVNHCCNIKTWKQPEAAEFKGFRWGVLGEGRTIGLVSLGDRCPSLTDLEPGFETTVGYRLAADWRSENDPTTILFTDPGEYFVQFKWYRPSTRPREFLGDPVRIEVRVPEGEDLAVYELLKTDKALVTAILSPIWPPPDDVAQRLKQLIKDFPKSSYVPYARFAVARWHATENGRFTPDDLALNYAQAALAQLKRIDATSFAYGPDALSLRRRIMKGLGYPEQEEVAAKLDRLFPDSLARLEDLAMRLTREEWARLDPRKPTRIKEPAVAPAEVKP